MSLTARYTLEPMRPVLRSRARRRTWRFYRDEVAPAFLIGVSAVVGPALLWLLKVPG